MVETNYPVFVEGQTLTRDDLNLLRDHLRDRDRTLGRLVGFGVSCGLAGEVRSDGLHIAGGLAVDQNGEPLLLPAERVLTLPPTAGSAPFDFVTGTDGFTVVLAATDTAQPSGGCAEEGCDGHAELHTTDVALHVVRGRLTGTRLDFSGEELLEQTPLLVSRTSAVVGDFDTLRDELLDRIGDRLDTPLRAKLAALSITTADLPAVRAFKAAFLNEVLFAALDLLRAEALLSVTCLRSTATPGVALGRLYQAGGAWKWDCGGRHHWEPPTGLTLAFLGGSCDRPAAPYLDRLVSLVDNFALPPVPAPGDPPKPGGVRPGDFTICHSWKGHYDCDIKLYPEQVLPHDWRRPWIEVGDFPFDPGLVNPADPWVVYGIDRPEIGDAGIIAMQPAFGVEAGNVMDVLNTLIAGTGVRPDVRVVSQAEADALTGFAPSGAVSPGDTVVLVADTVGKVVSTGRVAASRGLRQVGTALPAATAAANAALAETGGLRADVDTAVGRLDGVSEDVALLGGFRTDTLQWRQGVDLSLSGIEGRILTYGSQEVGRIETRLASQIPTMVSEAVQTMRAGLMVEVTSTVDSRVAATSDKMRDDFGRTIASTVERTGKLETNLDISNRMLEQTAGRIDNLYTGKLAGVAGRALSVDAELLRFAETMRDSVEVAAGDERAGAVRAALEPADAALGRLRERVQAGGAVLAGEREALASLVDSLVEAVRAAGAPAASVRSLRRDADGFKEVLNQ
ncbi:hypothetical protein [Phytohabitans suffuscus]|uniref:Uncharacterized protein n=1 Tax=Phytohabitans suffuscus TaxID=624315 RepID=A0A6F8YYA3_9ACTN|nr:hypothetical protein [Phytohabitans suffuscus]BCB91044.1 hypothetical protein Psuf_083570 [Phytohabitans suffuscus]